jgi:hypothetical protein
MFSSYCAALQTSCDIFKKFEILPYGANSYVTAWENILNCHAMAFCWLPTAMIASFPRKIMLTPLIWDLSV